MACVLHPHHDGSLLDVCDERESARRLRLRVRVPSAARRPRSIRLRVVIDAEPQFVPLHIIGYRAEHQWWQATVPLAPHARATYRFLLDYDDNSVEWLTAAGTVAHEPRDADDFLIAGAAAPPWSREGVMYQIFPDRFARSHRARGRKYPEWALSSEWTDSVIATMPDGPRQLFGGDLDGIADRIEHLTQLGVATLYLNPFFPGRSAHRYDAMRFDIVDPVLGGDEALIRLVATAHDAGMRVIGDLTTNHTGDGHEWFISSKDPDHETADYYLWRDRAAHDYESWYGVPSLPKLNWRNQSLRTRFIDGPDSVVGRWLREPYALDGWRIDVANMTGRHDNVDLNHEVQRIIRRTVDDLRPGGLLIAESTNDRPEDFAVDGWHGAMTYSTFTRPLWAWLRPSTGDFFGTPYPAVPRLDARGFVDHWSRFSSGWSWNARLSSMLAIDTHDTPRFATTGEPFTQRIAALLSVTLPGIPSVFAGDEFGLVGDTGEASRQPMPWNHDHDEDLLRHYRSLGALRRGSTALAHGGLRWLDVGPSHLIFEREDETERVIVAVSTAATKSEMRGEGGDLTVGWGFASFDASGPDLRIAFPSAGFVILRGPSRALPWLAEGAELRDHLLISTAGGAA